MVVHSGGGCSVTSKIVISNLRPDKYKVVPRQVPSSGNFVLHSPVLSAICYLSQPEMLSVNKIHQLQRFEII